MGGERINSSEHSVKVPKHGTKMAMVVEDLHAGLSRDEIAEKRGWDRQSVTYTIKNARVGGYYYDADYSVAEHRATPEYRLRMSEAREGVIGEVVRHFRRGALNDEVAELRQLPRRKVKDAKKRARRTFLGPADEEERKKAISRAASGKPARTVGIRYTDEQKKRFSLARSLDDLGYIAEATNEWQDVQSFLESQGAVFPSFYPDQIIVESLYVAINGRKERENKSILERKDLEPGGTQASRGKFDQICAEIDPKVFLDLKAPFDELNKLIALELTDNSSIREFESNTERLVYYLVRRRIPMQEVARMGNLAIKEVEEYSNRFVREGRIKPETIIWKDQEAESHNSYQLVRELFNRDLLTENGFWVRLHKIYRAHNRSLPDSYVDRIRLEVLLRVYARMMEGNTSVRTSYRQAAYQANYGFEGNTLRQEEEFLQRAVSQLWTQRNRRRVIDASELGQTID